MRHRSIFCAFITIFVFFIACATSQIPAPPDLSNAPNPDAAENALFVTIDMAQTWFAKHPAPTAETDFKLAARSAYVAIQAWRSTGSRAQYNTAAANVISAYPGGSK